TDLPAGTVYCWQGMTGKGAGFIMKSDVDGANLIIAYRNALLEQMVWEL
ncbi:6484_t:CDS:1, partial [Dentiscutata erythropus]